MKSVEEVQKMKVADLKQELTTRGLDTKGVKAVLVDRLLDAMANEGGEDLGNGTAAVLKAEDPLADSRDGDDEASEESESPATGGQESPKRATRGHSPSKQPTSPIKASPSPTPLLSPAKPSPSPLLSPATASPTPSPAAQLSPKLSLSPIKATPSPQGSPVKLPQVSPVKPQITPQETPIASPTKPLQLQPTGAVSPSKSAAVSPMKQHPAVLVSPTKSVPASPPKQTVSPSKFPITSPAKSPASPSKLAVAPAAASPVKVEPQTVQSAQQNQNISDSKVQLETSDKIKSEIDSTKLSEESAVNPTQSEPSQKEPKLEAQEANDVEMAENCEGGGEEFPMSEGGGNDQMEVEDSESLKRKHDESEEPKQEECNNGEKPKKIRLDHYTMRILPEDEPEFDEKDVLLDWYKSDLNLAISKEGFLRATPNVFDEFPWAYAGVKATHGFTSGKLGFEVKWVDNLSVKIDFGKVEAKHVLRVGWSELHTDLQLGEESLSFGYDSQGKLYNAGDMQDLEEAVFQKGDVIASFLNLESDPVEIKFTKNGTELGNSIQIPKANVEGKMFFPHILSRNVSFEVNFGAADSAHPLLEQFEMLAKVEATETNRVRGPKAPSSKAECEFVMLVGMACCGKTKWAKDHKTNNPDKHFSIIGTSSVVERAVKKTTLGGDKTPRVYDSFLMKAGRFVEKLVDLAPTRRRNYILDQSNVMPVVQRRKAAGFEGFKRRAVVVLPSDEDYQNRIKAREQEQGKSVPKSTLLDMKATFRLPEVGQIFSEVDFPELSREECEELLKKYNKEGADAGYHGQKSSRGGGWFNQGGFRGGRGQPGFRGGYRGPRRGGMGGGFRGGPPYRFRGDFRPPRGGGPARVPRDYSYNARSFGPPRGRGGVPSPQPLIPRRSEAPRSAWARGAPPMNGRGASPAPRMFHNAPRSSFGGGGRGYGGQQMGNQRPQQSIWTTGQPGGAWGRSAGGFPQQPDPWVQQVPDQGYGQSWGDVGNGRGGGGGTWQGYGGQTYGGYGRK